MEVKKQMKAVTMTIINFTPVVILKDHTIFLLFGINGDIQIIFDQ